MDPVRVRWMFRFPGGPWTAAVMIMVAGGGAVVLAGLPVPGVVLEAVGWPLLVVLVGLYAGVVPWAFPGPCRRRVPAAIGLFAYFVGTVPLLAALLSGPEPGLGRAAFLGAFVGLWMTGFSAAAMWWARRRGWFPDPRGQGGGSIAPG